MPAPGRTENQHAEAQEGILLKVIDFEDGNRVFCHEHGGVTVRSHIEHGDMDVVVAWSLDSTLYPMWLPRWTGKWIENKEEGTREKEILFDIYNNRCGWYALARPSIERERIFSMGEIGEPDL
jgi:hypothetical protein